MALDILSYLMGKAAGGAGKCGFEMVQNYLEDDNAVIFENNSMVVIIFTPPAVDHGIVFTTDGWAPSIATYGAMSSQMGHCTIEASLPTILTQGAGREDFDGPAVNQKHTYEYRDTSNFFVGVSGPLSETVIVISKT